MDARHGREGDRGAGGGEPPWRRRTAALLAATLAAAVLAALSTATSAGAAPNLISLITGETPAGSSDPAVVGSFTQPFSEPTIDGTPTSQSCLRDTSKPDGPLDNEPRYACKPAGTSINVLPNGRVMYFNALEGTENIKYSIVAELGFNTVNDQARELDLHGDPTGGSATWAPTTPADAGANPGGDPTAEHLLPAPLVVAHSYNAGALFCSDNTFLPDGRILANGGTDYYLEPGIQLGKNSAYGVSELAGIRQTRIYDPATNSWGQTGDMHYNRWYPTSVELPNGNVFTASGVGKLVKPIYPSHPLDSGTNVQQTETYDIHTGKWQLNPRSANHSLPLFPRLALLPDGKVFYNVGGQSFSPFGQSYDEVLWNLASVYDPHSQSWQSLGIPGLTDLAAGSSLSSADALKDALTNVINTVRQGGVPGFGGAITIPGFRGSTFSMMLPLKPDASGKYSSASFLTAGGVMNPPSPGSYFTTSDSRITTVDTAGGRDRMSTRPTGDLPGPRWFPSGVVLPTGQVLAFNGADRDEVAGPGVEIAKRQTELFDPATNRWTPLASSHDGRTYHNAAALLPDGRVLVGGHAPVSTLYLKDVTLPGGITAPHEGRDPTFEIYSPPYMSWGPQPVIQSAPAGLDYGTTFDVTTDTAASDIKTVTLVRNTSITHLVDANQRTVELPVVARSGNTLTLQAPPNANVAPPGAYMLFVNKQTSRGLIPSKAAQTFVGLSTLGP